MIYLGKEITATTVGSVLAEADCERCGTHYAYELTRAGMGRASAPYFLFQGNAGRRAERSATTDLSRRLANESEMVPCPTCGRVPQALIEQYRLRRYHGVKRWIAGGIGTFFFATIILPALASEHFRYDSIVPTVLGLVLFGMTLLVPVMVLTIRAGLRRRIDPNATTPPTLPPGTPTALLPVIDQVSGEVRLVPAGCLTPSALRAPATGASVSRDSARQRPPVAKLGGKVSVVLRPGELVLPPSCCVCLEPATRAYAPPLRADENSDLPVPICAACAAALRRRWWLELLMIVAALLATITLVVAVLPFGDRLGRWIMGGIFGALGGLILGVLGATRRTRPYTLDALDGARGVVRFTAVNPAYTALVADAARAREATSSSPSHAGDNGR